MAFPTTILAAGNVNVGLGGPFVGTNGAVYVITRDTTISQFLAKKATDPTSSWATAGSAVATTNGGELRALAACQYGNTIMVVTREAWNANENRIYFHIFDMGTDTWTTTQEAVKGSDYICTTSPEITKVAIGVRSNGDAIVLYEKASVTADISRARTAYARRVSGVWTVDVAVDNGGNAHWYPAQIIPGVGDRMHLYFRDHTNNDNYQRCLTSANALETFPAAFDANVANQDDNLIQRGAAFVSLIDGNTDVRMPYANAFNSDMSIALCNSADVPSQSIQGDFTGGSIAPGVLIHVASFACNGNVLYATYIDGNNDILYKTSVDSAAFSGATTIYTGTATELFTTIYTRGANIVMGVVFMETDVKYTEITIAAAASGGLPVGTRSMMGVGL